jgi:SCY1-like protein 2
VLDFSTIKNELFPVIASVFTRTSSLGIKVRGLEAFVTLCGGSSNNSIDDGLDGIMGGNKMKVTTTALDKYTMQEKILPLIKGIKTKEPGVMLAALKVLKQVGSVADTEFIAMDILPVLWTMSLGPLLNLMQFQSFMELIKDLSSRVEQEHTKKLQELSSSTQATSTNDDFMSFGGVAGFTPASANGGNTDGEDDFERLVQGKVSTKEVSSTNPLDAAWDATTNKPAVPDKAQATFAWSTPSPNASSMSSVLRPQQAPVSRTITPDLSSFGALTPQATQFSQPLQPSPSAHQFSQPLQPTTSNMYNTPFQPQPQPQQKFQSPIQPSVDWSSATPNAWPSSTSTSTSGLGNSMSNMSLKQQRPPMNTLSSFSLPPPPKSSSNSFQLPQPQRPDMPSMTSGSFNQQQNLKSAFGGSANQQQAKPAGQKTGLNAYESLI